MNRVSSHIRHMVAGGGVLLFATYWLIFYLTTDDGLLGGSLNAALNAIPALALALVVHLILEKHVWDKGIGLVQLLHVPLALGFAVLWYLAIRVIGALQGGSITEALSVQPFVPVAFAWQMFQGVTFYAVAALASLCVHLLRRIELLESGGGSGRARQPFLMLRTEEGTEKISHDEIVTISGAGDHAVVTLRTRTVTSSTNLSQFEALLPQEQFIRAHRSHIVSLAAIERSEPAGNGRTTLHLANGSTVITSRAGTRALREATV